MRDPVTRLYQTRCRIFSRNKCFKRSLKSRERGRVCPGFVWQLGRLHKPLLNRRICINCSLDKTFCWGSPCHYVNTISLSRISPFFFFSEPCCSVFVSFVAPLPRHKTPNKALELTNFPNETTILHYYYYNHYYYYHIIRLIDGEGFIRVTRVIE